MTLNNLSIQESVSGQMAPVHVFRVQSGSGHYRTSPTKQVHLIIPESTRNAIFLLHHPSLQEFLAWCPISVQNTNPKIGRHIFNHDLSIKIDWVKIIKPVKKLIILHPIFLKKWHHFPSLGPFKCIIFFLSIW